MNILIGDIGNTTSKICLIEIKTLKVKKINYFNSNRFLSKNFINKMINKVTKKKILINMLYFLVWYLNIHLCLKKT